MYGDGTHLLLPRQSSSDSDAPPPIDGDGGTGAVFLGIVGSYSEVQSGALAAGLIFSLSLTAIIALAFCFIRPYNNVVYAPRAKHADSKHAPPPVEKGLFGWIPPLIRTKEQALVEKVGLDAALFMRFIRMLRNIFAACTVVGCGILIPINLIASVHAGKYAPSNLNKLTPQALYGSSMFWAYVVVAYLFDFIIFFFLWTNYRAVLRLRRAYFDSPDYQRSLHARTLLVTDIAKDLRSDDGLVQLTENIKATEDTPRAAIARNVKDLPELVEEHDEAVKALEKHLAKYLKDPNKLPAKRPTCKVSKSDKGYAKGQQVDAIEYLTSRIKQLETEIKEVRLTIDKRNALSYGFASYERISEAHNVAYAAQKKGPRGTLVRLAPKPNDLIWKNLSMLKKERSWQNFINNLWVVLLTAIWWIPNLFIAIFLSNLYNLAAIWPGFRKTYDSDHAFWSIVQGIVAPAITTLFYFYLPAIFRKLVTNAGDVTRTARERHVMHKLFSFFLLNNLIVFSLFSAVFGYVSTVVADSQNGGAWNAIKSNHPIQKIVTALISISTYWISWLLQRNLGAAVDLSQLAKLTWGSFSRRFLSPTPRELIELTAPQPTDFASYYNYFLFYTAVTLCFAGLQPLALPVTAFYFWMDSFFKKYLVLYVSITKYESGGMFWRSLYNRVLICAFLGNLVIALLLIGYCNYDVNWPMLAAMIPLPFLIIGFKIYCSKAFDDAIHFYDHGKSITDPERNADTENKKRKGDRVGTRFGNPVLYKPLLTPMVAAKSQHLLKQIYSGRTSLDETGTVGGYSDVYMDAMDSSRPGKPSAGSNGFDIIDDSRLDFEHHKNNPQFGDEFGGEGTLFGSSRDVIRPGTPDSTMTRANTFDSSFHDRSRSQSRTPYEERSRSGSQDSDLTRVADGGMEYPRGYHQTPSMREHSPAGSDFSRDVGSGGGRRGPSGLRNAESREGLMSGAARMGRSPPPSEGPAANGSLTEDGFTPAQRFHTPGEQQGQENTSYEYFRGGRNL